MIKTPSSTVIGGVGIWTPNTMIMGSINQNLSYLIKSLFWNNEQGFAYDPNDLSTMFQDAAGTIPVTAAGQPVGLIKDKSGRNNHAYQATSAARPILRKNATTGAYYLELDGADDYLQVDGVSLPSPLSTAFAVDKTGGVYGVLLSAGNSGYFNLTASGAGLSGNSIITRKVPKDVVTFKAVSGNVTMKSSTGETTVVQANSFAIPTSKYIGLFAPAATIKFSGNMYGIIAVTKDLSTSEDMALRQLFNKSLGG